jgi:hypothetical protein
MCGFTATAARAGLTFVGFKSDIDNAKWLLDHLADFVHDKLFEFLLDCLAPEGKERKEEIRGFVIGCAERLSARIIQMCHQPKTERATNDNALVVIKDQVRSAEGRRHTSTILRRQPRWL